jgi:hypothetical protein
MTTWLSKMAKKKGITVKEMREEMRKRSAQADKSTSGFASIDKDRARELQLRGGEATKEYWINKKRG